MTRALVDPAGSRRAGVVPAIVLAALAGAGDARGGGGSAGASASPAAEVSERSRERLRFDCASEIDRRDLTLFANGTLRLRQGVPGIERMWLVELGPDELAAYLARLAEPQRLETPRESFTAAGEWVERCALELHLDGRASERFEFDRFDTLTLDLQRTVQVARELVERVDTAAPAEGEASLPLDYEAQIGDVLRRADGMRFRVNGYTSDGNGVELVGVEQPVTVYLPKAELSTSFAAVERNDG